MRLRHLVFSMLAATAACDDHEHPHEVPPVCEDLAEGCHHVDDALGRECHDVGHDGEEAACTMRHAECLAHCASVADAGPGADAVAAEPDAGAAGPDGGGGTAR